MNPSLSMANISEIARLTIEREKKMQQARMHMETSNELRIMRQSQYKTRISKAFIQITFLSIGSFSAYFSQNQNALFDNIGHAESLRIAEAKRLENEANAIEEKIKEIHQRARENVK